MTTIIKSDLVLQPEILMDAVQGEFQKVIALLGTGAAVVSPSLPGGLKGTSDIRIPYFGVVPEMQDITNDGDALTPAAFTMSSDTNSVKHAGQAIEITQWAQIAAMYADPYAELARQLRVAAERRFDKALIDAAIATTLSKNVYVDNATLANKKLLTRKTLVSAKALWGDEREDIALLVVHSNVYADLEGMEDNDGRPLLTEPEDGSPARFAGIPIKVSDRMTRTPGANAAEYESLILKKGALALWHNGNPNVQQDRDILKDSDLAALHVYFIAHLYSKLPGTTRPGVVKVKHNVEAD
jgi:HK97 family phage major capsid protein